ncbi:MAG: AMP-binding protein, partial [Solirubrobacterales bacterium]
MSATKSLTYEEACEAHRWRVPDRYNIAADVCDGQPPDRTAMIFEDFRGNQREVSWAEQRSLADRAANLLVSHGVERGDRVAVCAPASPETAAMFLGTWKAGAILLSLS